MKRLTALLVLFVLAGCRRHYPPVEAFELSEGGGCATLEDGTRYCWGSESTPPSDKPVLTPLAARAEPRVEQERFRLIGTELCDHASTPPSCETLAVVPASFAAGPHHACIVDAAARVACRGDADQGRLGAGASGVVNQLRAVPGVAGAQAVAVGDDFSCAMLKNLTVSCWGQNDAHALAQPEPGVHVEPLPVVGLFAVKKIGARGAQACASLTDGGLRCWGTVHGPAGISIGRPGTFNNVPMPVMFP